MLEKLAINGGPRTIIKPFIRYSSIGAEEAKAAVSVVKTGVLSKFLGCWDPDFYGGPRVQKFERNWSSYFGSRHAVSVNSNTSGLIAAIGAIGVEPGDEVIVSPWTMTASATSILVWNAIPVFADIDPATFNMNVSTIRRKITSRTRAIMLPDIFGQAADLDEIMQLAKKYKLKVIEDCAQAPGAFYKKKYAGTVADIGVFSLNYHKHIQTGEGGVCVTNDPELAERMQLIRNHGEAVAGDKGISDIRNIIGFNFRMTEIEAAIGIEQLKKLKSLVKQRIRAADALSAGLKDLEGLKTPLVKNDRTHVYYVYPLVIETDKVGVERSRILLALQAEGVPNLSEGYALIHLLPLYQKRIAYGSRGFPWTAPFYDGNVSYDKGICPVAERLHEQSFLGMELCKSQYTDKEVGLVIKAFKKVWRRREELR